MVELPIRQRGGAPLRQCLDLVHHRRQRVLGRDGEHDTTAAASGLRLDVEAEEYESVVDVGLLVRGGRLQPLGRYDRIGPKAAAAHRNSPVLIRYADDLVALCHSRRQAEQIKAQLAAGLAPRGLALNEDKTRITCLDEGFDFLGFTVRRYRKTLLITPSKTAVKRIRQRLRHRNAFPARGSNAEAVIARLELNPIIRGWAAYYRNVVSSKIFNDLDHYLWRLTYKWARHTHPNKPTRWVVRRYFGAFNRSRRDRWVFGDRDSGAYLLKFAWTRIVRHQMVAGTASPDDPALIDYWNTGRRSRIFSQLCEPGVWPWPKCAVGRTFDQ
ncbi:group II intron maturase-specific domain-containing protein [Nocardia vinacea]|uniref:group II intron maturase-specific domain-containing protein n=1 Tax=Nocardia vinacea TaxID=96468 RepID=UPI003433D67D